MKKTNWLTVLTLGALAASCGSVQDVQDDSSTKAGHTGAARDVVGDDDDDEDGDDENEVAVALDQVPEAVKKAALAAVPGFVLVSAEKETEEGELRYCLEGTANGESVEVEVNAADSKVVEIERGEDDD
jgi:uncharacterized membrane protein YkoI